MTPASISAVINTRNAADYLPFALRSLKPWVDEILVADMHSTDATVAIARSFGATVLDVAQRGFVEPARRAAVAAATCEWVLVLDADELVPEPLSRRLRAIATGDTADVVLCPFHTYLVGAPLRGTGWGPNHEIHPRFFRKGSLTFFDEIHSVPEPTAGARVITLSLEDDPHLAIQHFNYLGFSDFIARLNRYTTIEAEQALARGDQGSMWRAIRATTREAGWRFVKAGGFRDGWRGFYLSALMGVYRLATAAKVRQLREAGTEDDVRASYARLAEGFLEAYAAGSTETKVDRSA
jgi:glycosyltransferase involved in cell wall biosynthesis